MPTMRETFQINDPRHQARAVARLTKWGLEGTPQERRQGKEWYGMGHEAVRANQGDLSLRTATGIAAALSPGQDWSKRNIPSIGESQVLDTNDWEMIQRTYAGGIDALRGRRARGEKGVPSLPNRHPEVAAMLAEKAPHLSGNSDPMLLKAHSMLRGADPEEVMTRYDNPKTNAFFHGLLDPTHQESHLAVDYKMADLTNNSMQAPAAYRALGKGYYKQASRGKTNYQHYEDTIAMAGQAMAQKGGRSFAAFRQPLGAQSYLWNIAKNYELGHPERKMSQQNPGEAFSGPVRKGQRYMSPTGGRL
jgi:hypothetical protein